MAKKADKHTSLMRTRVVLKLILDGWGRSSIIQNLAEKWNLTERQLDNYISKARELMREEAHASMADALEWHLQARANLMQQTDSKSLKLAILKDTAKLQGLYTQKVEHSGKVELDESTRLGKIMAILDSARERAS